MAARFRKTITSAPFAVAVFLASIHVGTMGQAHSAEIRHWITEHDAMRQCSINGPISSPGDVDKMKEAALFGCRMLRLNSPGGSADVGLAIGDIIRTHQMHVFVDSEGICASACVFLFAAGIVRIPYGKVLIHRPYFGASRASYAETQERMDSVAARAKGFLKRMNVSESLFDMMMRVAPEDSKALTLEEMDSLGLGFFDPVYVETRENNRASKLGMTKQQFLKKKVSTAAKCGRIDTIIPSTISEDRAACWNREFPGYFGE